MLTAMIIFVTACATMSIGIAIGAGLTRPSIEKADDEERIATNYEAMDYYYNHKKWLNPEPQSRRKNTDPARSTGCHDEDHAPNYDENYDEYYDDAVAAMREEMDHYYENIANIDAKREVISFQEKHPGECFALHIEHEGRKSRTSFASHESDKAAAIISDCILNGWDWYMITFADEKREEIRQKMMNVYSN